MLKLKENLEGNLHYNQLAWGFQGSLQLRMYFEGIHEVAHFQERLLKLLTKDSPLLPTVFKFLLLNGAQIQKYI